MARPTDLVKTIALEPKHGRAVARRIQQVSREALPAQQSSLYPALHRLEQQAWIRSEGRTTETGRMALTSAGRGHLETELANWTEAINLVQES